MLCQHQEKVCPAASWGFTLWPHEASPMLSLNCAILSVLCDPGFLSDLFCHPAHFKNVFYLFLHYLIFSTNKTSIYLQSIWSIWTRIRWKSQSLSPVFFLYRFCSQSKVFCFLWIPLDYVFPNHKKWHKYILFCTQYRMHFQYSNFLSFYKASM